MKQYRNSPPPPPPLAKLATFLLLTLLAAPSMAQVDWSILGDTGSSACPSGQSERNATIATFGAGSLKKDSVQISTIRLTYSSVAGYAGTNIGGGRTIYLEVKGPNGQRVGSPTTLGSVRISPAETVTAQTTIVSSLTPNTPYTVEVLAVRTLIGKSCFRTAFDLERPLAHYGDINHSGTASGCYAFVDLSDPSNRGKVQACQCGARNSSGQWARTDSEDGYEYIIQDADWRREVGCTTN